MKYIISNNELDNIDDTNYCIYFYTSWMPYHKRMINIFSTIEKKYSFIKFYAVDCDSFKDLALRFDVKEVPSLVIINNNKIIKKIIGIAMASAIKKIFTDIYNKQT